MWPFNKDPKLAPGKKLSLISVQDYPKEAYTAYWEIGIAPDYKSWFANLYSTEGLGVLETASGASENEEDARRQSQTWVVERIENYRRRIV